MTADGDDGGAEYAENNGKGLFRRGPLLHTYNVKHVTMLSRFICNTIDSRWKMRMMSELNMLEIIMMEAIMLKIIVRAYLLYLYPFTRNM